MEMFGQGIRPQIAFHLKSHDIPFGVATQHQPARTDPRLKDAEGLGEFLLPLLRVVGGGLAENLPDAEVNHRPVGLGVVLQLEGFQPFHGQISLGIEQPFQIPQHPPPVFLERDNALLPPLLRIARIIIGQAVQQTRLQFFDGSQISHGRLCSGIGWRRKQLQRPAFQQRIFTEIGGKNPLSQAQIRFGRMLKPVGLATQPQRVV